MRVVQLINSLATGGAERLLFDMAPYWDRERYDVRIVYLLSGRAQEEQIASCPLPVECAGFRRLADVIGMVRLGRILRRHDPDVIHTNLMLADILGRLRGRPRRGPAVVTTLHSSASHYLERRGRGAGWLYRWVLRATPSAVTVACSEASARTFTTALPELGKVEVVPNRIDLRRAAGVPLEERDAVRRELGLGGRFVCLCVARLTPPKGHRTLIDAARRLPGEPDTLILLAGDGELRGGLEQRVLETGMNGKVRFLGNRTDVPRLLRAADLFVLASDWEGMPIALMEAMAAGLPVVVTDVGEMGRVVRESNAGAVVPPGDARALADAIARLCGDPVERAAAASRSTAGARERFDVRTSVSEYERLYDDLVRRREASSSS
jgi:glycosyltransferase involved in cell wall biosynthesis